MASVSPSLPAPAQAAAQKALEAALDDVTLKEGGGEDDGSEQEVEAEAEGGLHPLALNDATRTVFDDPTTFNVKVSTFLPIYIRFGWRLSMTTTFGEI